MKNNKPMNPVKPYEIQKIEDGIYEVFIPGDEVKKKLDNALNTLSGEIIPDNEKTHNIPTLFDMGKYIHKQSIITSKNIRGERNLLELPIANYSKTQNPGNNYVTYDDPEKHFSSSMGTADGALNGLDERILWGVISRSLIIYRGYLISFFTIYDVMKELGINPGGGNRKIIKKSLDKLGGAMFSTSKYISRDKEKNETITKGKKIPLFMGSGVEIKTYERNREMIRYLFVVNKFFEGNFLYNRLVFLNNDRYLQIKNDTTRRTWAYLTVKLGKVHNFYSEQLNSLCKKVSINDNKESHRIARLKESVQ